MPQSQTKQTSSTTSPWDAQAPYLTQAFQSAQGTYNQGAGNLYGGQQVAQFNPDQLATFKQQVGFGNNLSPATNTLAAGNTLTGAGTQGVTQALDNIASFKPTGGTGSNIAAAGQYADNPYIGQQVTAAMRDATNNVNENVLPSIARNAAAGGDINSNRTAIQQGIVQRGLTNEAGDISANMRGQAYGQGLNLAEQGSEFNNNAILQAMRDSGTLASGAVNSGIGANDAGVNQAGNLFNLANVGGAGQQTAAQTAIDNAKAMNEYAPDRLMQLLQGEFGITGSRPWGQNSNGTETDTTQASPLSLAGGLMGAAGSMMLPGFGGVSAAGNLYKLFKGNGLQ